VQVHAVKEGAFANMVNIARIGREPKEIGRGHVRLDVGETQANVGIGRAGSEMGTNCELLVVAVVAASFAVARAA
jgi:hypothetical protein